MGWNNHTGEIITQVTCFHKTWIRASFRGWNARKEVFLND